MGRGNQVMNHSDRLTSSYRDCGVGGGPATTHKLYCIFIWCGSCQQQHSWQQGVRRSLIMCSEFFLVERRKIIRLHAAGEQRWIVDFQDVWQFAAGGGPSATKQFRKAFCCSKWGWHCPAQQGCNCTSIYIFLMQSLIMSVLCIVIVWPVCILLYIWAGMGRGNQVMNHSDRLMSSYRDCGVGGGPCDNPQALLHLHLVRQLSTAAFLTARCA